jgi:hypothetical protein
MCVSGFQFEHVPLIDLVQGALYEMVNLCRHALRDCVECTVQFAHDEQGLENELDIAVRVGFWIGVGGL